MKQMQKKPKEDGYVHVEVEKKSRSDVDIVFTRKE